MPQSPSPDASAASKAKTTSKRTKARVANGRRAKGRDRLISEDLPAEVPGGVTRRLKDSAVPGKPKRFSGSAKSVSVADLLMRGFVETAVGPVRSGSVVSVNRFAGVAHLIETRTNRPFIVSRRFVDPAIFDALDTGTAVRFRDNGHNAAAVVRIR